MTVWLHHVFVIAGTSATFVADIMSFRPKTLRYPAKDSGRLTVLADFVKCKVETMSIYLLGSTIIEVWFGYHPPSNRCACKRQTCTNQHYEAESKNKGALNGYSDRSPCVRIKPSGNRHCGVRQKSRQR